MEAQSEPPAAKRAKPVVVTREAIMPDPGERLYDVTIGQELRSKLVLHLDPINPHADITAEAAGGERRAYVRDVQHVSEDGGVRQTALCCLYGPDGRCEHMLQPEAVAKLRRA